jgi:hypothetical protein
MSGFWWSTSFWQGPHGPADHRRQQVRRLPVFSPGAAHRLAVQPDHQRGGIGEPGQHLDRQPAPERRGHSLRVRQGQHSPEGSRPPTEPGGPPVLPGVHVAWVWLLWSERRPTDRAGPRPCQAGPAPGTRAAGDARGPRCHPGMLTPKEPHPCGILSTQRGSRDRTSLVRSTLLPGNRSHVTRDTPTCQTATNGAAQCQRSSCAIWSRTAVTASISAGFCPGATSTP